MIRAADIIPETIILLDNSLYKVLSIELRGAAKSQRIPHLKLKSIPDGKYAEKTFQPDDKIEQVHPDIKTMEFSYKDENNLYFIDVITFEQYGVPKDIIGEKEKFIKEGDELPICLYENRVVNINFPKRMKIKVIQAPPGIKQVDTTYKRVVLENNIELDVPQFIKEEDIVEIDTETGKYIDRVKDRKEEDKV